jgi:hypothetical protein
MSFSTTVAQRGLNPPPEIEAAIRGVSPNPEFDAAIRAIISNESQWINGLARAEPRINDSSYGLMQILLGTARGYDPSVTAAQLQWDGPTNIFFGSSYFGDMLTRFGNLQDAFAAYNGGPGAVARRQSTGSYNTGTFNIQAYVDSAMAYYDFYMGQNLYGPASSNPDPTLPTTPIDTTPPDQAASDSAVGIEVAGASGIAIGLLALVGYLWLRAR